MTKAELIRELEQYPDDMLVTINATEEGKDDVTKIERLPVKLNANRSARRRGWGVGIHEDDYSPAQDATYVLVLSSKE